MRLKLRDILHLWDKSLMPNTQSLRTQRHYRKLTPSATDSEVLRLWEKSLCVHTQHLALRQSTDFSQLI